MKPKPIAQTHLKRKIQNFVISSFQSIIRLFFTPNQHNCFMRRFIYVLSQVFCDQEMCMFIFSIEILREEQVNRLYNMMSLVVVKEIDHSGHNSCMILTHKRRISNRLFESYLEDVSYTDHGGQYFRTKSDKSNSISNRFCILKLKMIISIS